MKWLCIFVGVLVTVTQATACYNDIDTNLTELRDNLDITLAVAGRFTIYPPEYYKKRIEIQTAILKKDPNNLEAYDNISVAFDRIGDSTNAMNWITEKRKHLRPNSASQQLYSTEANEGTILIVRWIRGHGQGDLTDAIESEKHIAKALEINPNAHFGREFAQLYCIRAMIECGKEPGWELRFSNALIRVADREQINHKKLQFGIAGMMVLGAAWQMPAMVQAIAKLMPEEQQVVALCASRLLHYKNLLDDKDRGRNVTESFPVPDYSEVQYADRHYVMLELIRGAERFQKHRQEWIAEKLEDGKHTDNDPDFWKGFQDVDDIEPKNLTRATWWTPYRRILTDVVAPVAIVLGILALPIYLIYRGARAIAKRKYP